MKTTFKTVPIHPGTPRTISVWSPATGDDVTGDDSGKLNRNSSR